MCPDQMQYCTDEKKACFPDYTCWRPSGDGLIGGTNWIVGYNVASLSKAQIRKAKKIVQKQLELSGQEYNEAIFKKYQFVLGIGVNTESIVSAEGWRVFRDHLANGQYSAETQGLYNSLKGRAFGELGCHSNGAMICLAALENNHVRAKRVVLYGPQITFESLKKWNDLKTEGVVKSVQIYVNQGDPIPPFAMLYTNDPAQAQALIQKAMLDRNTLEATIRAISPDLNVRTLDCRILSTDLFECHYMKAYTASVQKLK